MAFVALGEHGRNEGVDAVDHAIHVNAEREAPVVDLVFPDLALRPRGHAGVVAQHVHGSELGERRVTERLDGLEFRDIGANSDHLMAERAHLGHCGVERVLVQIGEHHLHALVGETFAHRPSDAAGTSGDDRDPAPEFLHDLPLTHVPEAPGAVSATDCSDCGPAR